MLGLIKESSVIVDLLESVAKTDDFIHRLLTIYKKAISRDIYSKKPYLSIIRSDFFFDAQSLSWKLIEINTIAVAGGFFSDGIDKLYLLVELITIEISKSMANGYQTFPVNNMFTESLILTSAVVVDLYLY